MFVAQWLLEAERRACLSRKLRHRQNIRRDLPEIKEVGGGGGGRSQPRKSDNDHIRAKRRFGGGGGGGSQPGKSYDHIRAKQNYSVTRRSKSLIRTL